MMLSKMHGQRSVMPTMLSRMLGLPNFGETIPRVSLIWRAIDQSEEIRRVGGIIDMSNSIVRKK